MSIQCLHECCFPDTTCALGHTNRAECEHWSNDLPKLAENGSLRVTPSVSESSDIPWNGYTLGTSDLAIIGGRGHPAVIGLIGPPDSGKTSLLAFLYMWLLKYGAVSNWTFAGSWTLGGWESVVQYSRWKSEPPPTFPPHTSSTGRHPGILHVAFRCNKTGQIRDVMFTDAPGEWFTQWARVPSAHSSEGARWVVERSDALLLLVDSDALADREKLPSTRRAIRDLMDRTSAHASGPIAIVRTKDDIHVPTFASDSIENAAEKFLPNADTLRTTIKNPKTIESCFSRAIEMATAQRHINFGVERRLSHNPFLAFRKHHVGS